MLTVAALLIAATAAAFGGWQAWTARDSEQRQLRPYLYVVPDTAEVTENPDASFDVAVQMRMKVLGLTPASGVSPAWEVTMMRYPPPTDFTSNYILKKMPMLGIAAPAEPYNMGRLTIHLAAADVVTIEHGEKRIYAIGTVIYKDAFAHVDWTNFCWNSTIYGLKQTPVAMEACNIYNRADWSDFSADQLAPAQITFP